MEFTAIGGFGESGRTCFLLEMKNCGEKMVKILVDCGIMEEEKNRCMPAISPEMTASIDYVFLTHSHKNHGGALSWLAENGLAAAVYMTEETRRQLDTPYETTVVFGEDGMGTFCPEPGITVAWGRSGHCSGSVWFHISNGTESAFFSGDYQEKSPVYTADPVKNMAAELAVVEAAFGNDETPAEEKRSTILEYIKKRLSKGRSVLLPVPKYGRGLELFYLINREMPEVPVYAGKKFIRELELMAEKNIWIHEEAGEKFREALAGYGEQHSPGKKDLPFIRIITDPQLKQPKHQRMAKEFLAEKGSIVFTGKVKAGSFSECLLKEKQAVCLPYPSHQNLEEARSLCENNRFQTVVYYHNAERKIRI